MKHVLAIVGALATVAFLGPSAGAVDTIRYGHPAWSPDGKLIAFDSNRDSGSSLDDVYVMSANGTNVKRLASSADGLGKGGPTWAPNSRTIAYEAGGAIDFVNVAGRVHRRITPVTDGLCCLSWSPRGRKIAFTSGGGETGTDGVYVVDPAGRNVSPVAEPRDGLHSYGESTWSGDGQRMAFRVGEAPDTGAGITPYLGVVSRYEGRIKRFAVGRTVVGPAWSPRGPRIAFTEIGGMDVWLSVVDLRTGKIRRLVRNGWDPTWSPNGRELAFQGDSGIWVVRADGSHARQILPAT